MNDWLIENWLIIVSVLAFYGVALRFGIWVGENNSERQNIRNLVVEVRSEIKLVRDDLQSVREDLKKILDRIPPASTNASD